MNSQILDDIKQLEEANNEISQKRMFIRWEVMRLKYNIFLALVVILMFLIELLLTNHEARYWKQYWYEAVMYGGTANVMYSLVYVVEAISRNRWKKYLSDLKAKRLFNIGFCFFNNYRYSFNYYIW